MFVIWGSRYYFRTRSVTGYGQCNNCGRFGWLKNYDARKFFHLYFIPLIPMGSRKRLTRACSACDRLMEMPAEHTDKLAADLVAVLETPAPDTGEVEGLDRTIHELAEPLLQIGRADELERIAAAMEKSGLAYHAVLLRGQIEFFKGPKGDGETWYRKAIETAPDPMYATRLLAHYYRGVGRNDEAIITFEHVSSQSPEDEWPLWNLLELYTAQKRDEPLHAIYEKLFERWAELKADKKFVKAYQKLCKKLGKQPRADV